MTDANALFDVGLMFGSIQIVTTQRREGDDLVLGGYSIERDRHGKEVRRTKDEENCRAVGYFRR